MSDYVAYDDEAPMDGWIIETGDKSLWSQQLVEVICSSQGTFP